MANEDNDDWLVQLIYAKPEDDREGPPEDWPFPSWFNNQTKDWYWKGKADPCPVKALGLSETGAYVFVSGAKLVRHFKAGELHGAAGPNDLFGGDLAWPERHFRRFDRERNRTVGAVHKQKLMGAMILACRSAGYYDNAVPHRSVGTWRAPDNDPVIHCGDVILHGGKVYEPGDSIGGHRYVLGPTRELPSLKFSTDRQRYELQPCTLDDCRSVAAQIATWNWHDAEGQDLFLGGLFCDMLGDALHWKPHRFIRAQPGAGKSMLLKFVEAVLGPAAHPTQRNFTRALLEQRFSNTAAALLLDEMESDTDGEKMRRVFELIRLMSDDGATGGRGTSGGTARSINLHGAVTMVATLAEAWRPQDRSRIAYIELGRISEREGYSELSREEMEETFARARKMSAGLRARAIAHFPLFRENLALARSRIMELGGSPRDADQLGYLVAGWATMTRDTILEPAEIKDLERFSAYIMTVTEEAEGTDDPSECLHTMYGLPSGNFDQSRELTIGQVIAAAREGDTGARMRDALRGLGLCLQRQRSEVDGRLEEWPEAWLAIANKHPKLEKLFADYPNYQTPRRAQILSGLKRTINGVPHVLKASKSSLHFGGVPSRCWLVPPPLLPVVENSEATTAA